MMVAPWLATLDWRHLNDRDIDIVAKLIADPRATGSSIYTMDAKHVSPRLRKPIAVRLLEASTDNRLRGTLNTLVRNMPPGTYAELLPEEKALLADRTLRLRSSALVARLSDQGPVRYRCCSTSSTRMFASSRGRAAMDPRRLQARVLAPGP